MSKEKETNGATDRQRARAMWELRQNSPRCLFCKRKATMCYKDHISPIFIVCDGCYEALGYGLAAGYATAHGTKDTSWIGGDAKDVIEWYGEEHLAKWTQMAKDRFGGKRTVLWRARRWLTQWCGDDVLTPPPDP